ncbi:HNH endonuclease [Mycobacterium phage BaboJay]|nr:HNH endonuclease [Mycobacterium phage BaboJay]
MNEVECAWVAGILEGEGSFTLGAAGQRKHGKRIQQLQVTCGMTDEDTIRKLHRIAGIGNVYLERRKDPRREHAKQLYVWQASKRLDIVPFLHQIRPHMSLRRGARIDELLAYADANPLLYHQPVVCGTRRAYRKGCRCAKCRACMATYARDLRKRKRNEVPQDQDS